jgi:hypothetical protein
MAVHDPRLSVPRGWHCSTDDHGGLTARAGTAAASGVVRPTLTLVSHRVDAPRREWEAGRLRDLAHARPGFDLEDHDDFDLAGHEVTYRRYSHRTGGSDVLCEEWTWLVEGRGLVLTGAVAREDYADYCDVFEAVAETVDPEV